MILQLLLPQRWWGGVLIYTSYSYAVPVRQYRPMDKAIYSQFELLTGVDGWSVSQYQWLMMISSNTQNSPRRRRRIFEGRGKSIKLDHLLWCVCWAALIFQEVYRREAEEIQQRTNNSWIMFISCFPFFCISACFYYYCYSSLAYRILIFDFESLLPVTSIRVEIKWKLIVQREWKIT